MKAGEIFPAIDVFYDGENYWLVDGYHRVRAYMIALPGEAIECNVFQGSLQDAQWHSYGVNRTHGLRRSNEDKKRAVTFALAHPAAEGKSNVQIAEHCGVDEKTVRKYRCHRQLTSEIPKSDNNPATSIISKSRPRKGRDGRTISTAKIGKGKRRKASRPRSAAEYYDAKQAGLRVGRPGSMVKLELPNNNTTNCAYDLLRYFTFEYLQKVFSEIVRLNQESQAKE
jgi:hypothetical protein